MLYPVLFSERKGFVVSKFKASRQVGPTPKLSKEAEEITPAPAPPPPPVVQDMLDQLEVLDEFSDRADQEKYNRLATVSSFFELNAMDFSQVLLLPSHLKMMLVFAFASQAHVMLFRKVFENGTFLSTSLRSLLGTRVPFYYKESFFRQEPTR